MVQLTVTLNSFFIHFNVSSGEYEMFTYQLGKNRSKRILFTRKKKKKFRVIDGKTLYKQNEPSVHSHFSSQDSFFIL